MDFSERCRLLDPRPLALELGYERLPTGVLHIAARTDMHGCSGAMLNWWFGSGVGTREYRWWHPLDHISSTWKHGSVGEVVGRTHIVEERFTGSAPQKLSIQFRDPTEFFAAEELQEARRRGDVSAIFCVRGGLGHEPPLDDEGRVLGTRLIHIARDTPWGLALRSHFFLGVDMATIGARSSEISDLIPDEQAPSLLQHCYDEFTYLSRVLPGIWLAEGASPSELTRPW